MIEKRIEKYSVKKSKAEREAEEFLNFVNKRKKSSTTKQKEKKQKEVALITA